MTTPLDLEAIEAAARAPMSFDRPKINCTHDEERGHAPWCFACDVADRASRPVPFEQRGRGDVIRLVAEVRRLRTDNVRLDDVARGALDDLARVRAELDEARAHLRSHIHCDSCDRLATRTHPDTARFGCDVCGVGEGWTDTTHADAVRTAVKR